MTQDPNAALVAKLDAQQQNPKGQHFWSQTYTGEAFYYDPELIKSNPYKLEDIAHQTSTISRYGGAAIYPYWVSQHQVALAYAIWEETHDPVLVLDALFHDGEEGYTGDYRTPIKDANPGLRAISRPINTAMRLAMRKAGIPVPDKETDIVRAYDRRIVADEKRIVMQPAKQEWYAMDGFEPLGLPAKLFEEKTWRQAKKEWLEAVAAFAMLARQAEAI